MAVLCRLHIQSTEKGEQVSATEAIVKQVACAKERDSRQIVSVKVKSDIFALFEVHKENRSFTQFIQFMTKSMRKIETKSRMCKTITSLEKQK